MQPIKPIHFSRKPVRFIVSALSRLFVATVAVLLLGGTASAQTLLVSAAASLTDAFRELGQEFSKTHPGNKVEFNFAASDVLVRQILEGAPVDVFASADLKAMDNAAAQNAIETSTRVNFAANRLVLALPPRSALKLSELADLRQPAVKRVAIGQPAGVPAGRYAKAALDEAKLWSALEEKFIYTQNVRQSLDYIARGEVDAGFVYATDAAALRDKVTVAFAIATAQPIVYPIALVKRSKQAKSAQQFVDLVRSTAGQQILARYGFAKP
jgi:molybdate transport system substrate-binding protein